MRDAFRSRFGQRAWSGCVLALMLVVAAVLAVGPAVALIRLAQAPAKPPDVDVELVLAVDVSLSMDPEEQRLQREGYIGALLDPEIMKAIKAGQHGRIAITYVEWAGPDIQIHLLPWTIIDSPASAAAFTTDLQAKEYSRYRRTSISAALAFAARLFEANPYRGTRRVIDVSGDGVNNSGPPLAAIRERILEDGIVINGLPIVLRPTMGYSSWDLPNLDKYYANCVIGGPGSFMIPITKPEEFATATRQKLLQEISSLPAVPRAIPAQLLPPPPDGPGSGGYDCTLLERGVRRW